MYWRLRRHRHRRQNLLQNGRRAGHSLCHPCQISRRLMLVAIARPATPRRCRQCHSFSSTMAAEACLHRTDPTCRGRGSLGDDTFEFEAQRRRHVNTEIRPQNPSQRLTETAKERQQHQRQHHRNTSYQQQSAGASSVCSMSTDLLVHDRAVIGTTTVFISSAAFHHVVWMCFAAPFSLRHHRLCTRD